MKKTATLIATLFLFSCQQESLVIEKGKEALGKKLTVSLPTKDTTSLNDYTIKEFEVKTKWYIGIKYYSDGIKKCKPGLGICKLKEIYPKIKLESAKPSYYIQSANEEFSEATIEIYENFIKVTFPHTLQGLTHHDFSESEILFNTGDLRIENKNFNSIIITQGAYQIKQNENGTAYLLAKYSLQ